MSDYREKGVVFRSGDNRLVGVVTSPEGGGDTGFLFLVGGPQYRVGSHRQFTLLARRLAEVGFSSLRFDQTGMGDSEGAKAGFDKLAPDIASAIATMREQVPGLSRIFLWGLCDAASAAMMFGHKYPEVSGLVLLNPWVHEGDYSPEVKLSHYFRQLGGTRDYWRRLFTGKINIFSVLGEFAGASVGWLRGRSLGSLSTPANQPFAEAMLQGFEKFRYRSLVILSENDLTAQEFAALTARDRSWKRALSASGVSIHTVTSADHTFSKKEWQEQVAELTIDWARQP